MMSLCFEVVLMQQRAFDARANQSFLYIVLFSRASRNILEQPNNIQHIRTFLLALNLLKPTERSFIAKGSKHLDPGILLCTSMPFLSQNGQDHVSHSVARSSPPNFFGFEIDPRRLTWQAHQELFG